MDADLDLLLIAVFCTAADLLPEKPYNAKRIISDAEVVTLCVAQAIMGIPSDPRFRAVASRRLTHLFPWIPQSSGLYKRRERLSDTIETLISEFARHSPGHDDELVLVDSAPVECCRSRETVKRAGASSLDDALANAADYGYCASHSRYFYGFRLHSLFALDGTQGVGADVAEDRREDGLLADACVLSPPARPATDCHRRTRTIAERRLTSMWQPRRADPPPATQRRARQQSSPRTDPPAHRVDLLDLQRHPHPRAPRRTHPAQPPNTPGLPLRRPQRRDRAEPPPRPPEPLAGLLHHLNPWNYSSSGPRTSPARRVPAAATSARGGRRPSSQRSTRSPTRT